MSLLNSLRSKLTLASLILSLCIFPSISTNVYADDEEPVLSPDIAITKTVDPAEVTPSTEVAFEIVVTNTGDCTLDPITVNDTIPDGLSYVADSALVGGVASDPSISSNTLSWNLTALEPGDSTTITYNVLIGDVEAGTLTNTARPAQSYNPPWPQINQELSQFLIEVDEMFGPRRSLKGDVPFHRLTGLLGGSNEQRLERLEPLDLAQFTGDGLPSKIDSGSMIPNLIEQFKRSVATVFGFSFLENL